MGQRASATDVRAPFVRRGFAARRSCCAQPGRCTGARPTMGGETLPGSSPLGVQGRLVGSRSSSSADIAHAVGSAPLCAPARCCLRGRGWPLLTVARSECSYRIGQLKGAYKCIDMNRYAVGRRIAKPRFSRLALTRHRDGGPSLPLGAARALRDEEISAGRWSRGHQRPAATRDGLGSSVKRRQSASMTAGSNWLPELRWSSVIASSELRAA